MTSQGIIGDQRGFQYKHGDRPLEGFTIQRAAGRGGFGEVYYGISDGGREVALKVIHTYEQIELRGISHCMNLKSPHLVTIFDVKYGLDGRPWVIMEFVSGPSLRELLDAAPSGLGVPKAAFFLREIAKSLTYLHDCGIVHRDLKPGNIFYENGYVKMGDYGLSKAIMAGQNSGQTITVGTVHYMAPEIGEGHYDKGIDLYALGALLYEMLTGQVPFFGASPTEVLMKHLNAPVDLSNIEEPFATVIRKAMAKNPAERYQSAQEMVEAVFGSEQVRNSVSHFAPESLSIVAGHVARKLPTEPFAGSSSVTKQPYRDVLGQFVNRLMNRGMEAALKPCRRIGRRLDRFLDDKGDRAIAGVAAPIVPPVNPPAPAVTEDPISSPQRRALAAMAIGLIAVGCAFAHRSYNPGGTVLFSFLAIAGGTLGALMGARRIAPGFPAHPRYLRALVAGGFAALCAGFSALPLALNSRLHAPRFGEAWVTILASVFLLDWIGRTRPDRRARVDLAKVVSALILGAILGAIIDGAPALSAGIVAGISLAVQIVSAWVPATGTAGIEPKQDRERVAVAADLAVLPGSSEIISPMPAPAGLIAAPEFTLQPYLVPNFARVMWLLFFIAFATLCLFLVSMLVVNVTGDRDEQAAMFGFAIPSALFAGLCLNRSKSARFTSFWPYLFRPVLQIACIGSIAVAMSCMGIGHVQGSDMPVALFFVAFPAVVLVVLTFFARTGGGMSQLASTIPSQAPVESDGDEFFLARVAGGAGRLAASVLASAILLAAVLLGLAATADIPGLFNSELVSPNIRRDIQRTFGNADWPRLMRTLGWVASVILAVGSIAIFMQVRRRAGVVHMLRAVGAVVLLFAFVLMLGPALPAWTHIAPTRNGWEMVDEFLKGASTTGALRAAAPLVAGLVLLMWPSGRRSPSRAVAAAQEAE